jgi:hypothetical protein
MLQAPAAISCEDERADRERARRPLERSVRPSFLYC